MSANCICDNSYNTPPCSKDLKQCQKTNVTEIKNLFSDTELDMLKDILLKSAYDHVDYTLGRVVLNVDINDTKIYDKVVEVAEKITGHRMSISHCVYSEYSSKHGNPDLPPHFDFDENNLFIGYQLKSNTDWPVGVNLDLYNLEDNSAIAFNANTNIHWRPWKKFSQGEYVRVIFFRLHFVERRKTYSDIALNQLDPVYKEVRDYRDSICNNLWEFSTYQK